MLLIPGVRELVADGWRDMIRERALERRVVGVEASAVHWFARRLVRAVVCGAGFG